MPTGDLSVVTGAFGYTGRHIARRLLAQGTRVRTLTNHPHRASPFGDRVSAAPFDFGDPARMAAHLEGAEVLYNTYWIRFPRGRLTFDDAVHRTRALIAAAESASVPRIVHISITNASEKSPLPYFRGKALAETAVRESGLSYGIIKPTVVFGDEDILLNNIAWFLRRFPLFPVFGGGDYPVQPVFADDLAALAVEAGQERGNVELDAAGPETFRYDELLGLIARDVGGRARLVRIAPGIGLLLTRLMGYLLRDVVITRDEVDGLMAGLLVSNAPPAGTTAFTAWLRDNAQRLGASYASELRRHYR